MFTPKEEIEKALETLQLPKLVTKQNIKEQYYFLAKKNHPDVGGTVEEMESLNYAYTLLIQYIDDFRYAFDDEEIVKQFPGVDYVQRFKP